MIDTLTHNQLQVTKWFEFLRNEIRNEFELIEKEFSKSSNAKFEVFDWQRPQKEEGGGQASVMRGNVFEKVGVNISAISSIFGEEFRKEIPGTSESANFFATGISLVSHMSSPLVPAIHMNTRFIQTQKSWFGGGIDLTPMFEDKEVEEFFHDSLREMCDQHDKDYYTKFSKWCDEYFYLKHRNEPRGIGGIFYDYLDTGDFERDFNFTKSVGLAFLKIYPIIVRKNMYKKWTNEQREHQLRKRGRYVEFNLLYDRGTKFGLMTGGNVEAILMSLPPEVKW